MEEKEFNPFGLNMPWNDDDSNTSSSEDDEKSQEQHEFISEVPDVEPVKQTDVFTALEEKLKLPIGSTKEGLKEAKQIHQVLKTKVDMVVKNNQAIERKEKLSENGLIKLSPETFDRDRERIRNEAWRLYHIVSNLLDKLNEQLDNTIDISADLWSSASSLATSVSNTLDKIVNITIKLRQEEDLRQIELQKVADANKALDDDGTVELVPAQMNSFIMQIVEEEDRKRKIEMGILPAPDTNTEENNEDD